MISIHSSTMVVTFLVIVVAVTTFLPQETRSFVSPSTSIHRTTTATTTNVGLLQMSSTSDEVAKLLAQAAKAREDAARLSKELGKDDTVSSSNVGTMTAAVPTKTPDEIISAIRSIDFTSGVASTQITALDTLRREGSITLYKSATVEYGSGDLRSYPVSLSMLQSRSGLTSETLGIGVEDVSLDDFKYGTLYVTGGCSVLGVAALALLPENIGATVCYLVAIIPILWLGLGSTAPGAIAGLIKTVKGVNDDTSKVDRVCRHEAAHFLCGYLCGLPIANYATTEENIPRVEFYYSADGPATTKRELSESEVNALTVVAMSGAVAEAMEFGKAGGANSDLIELANIFRTSEKFLGSEKQQDLTRWGALTAYRLLTGKKDKLDALVKAFSAQKPISECIAILEQ